VGQKSSRFVPILNIDGVSKQAVLCLVSKPPNNTNKPFFFFHHLNPLGPSSRHKSELNRGKMVLQTLSAAYAHFPTEYTVPVVTTFLAVLIVLVTRRLSQTKERDMHARVVVRLPPFLYSSHSDAPIHS
jgi:hypothetical protein